MNATTAAAAKANAKNDDLNAQIETLRADLSKLMATVSGDVSDGLDEAGRQLGKTSRDARVAATNAVTDHPLATLGLAVGVGVLLGLVARKG